MYMLRWVVVLWGSCGMTFPSGICFWGDVVREEEEKRCERFRASTELAGITCLWM